MKRKIQLLYVVAVLSLMAVAHVGAQEAVTTDGSTPDATVSTDTSIESMAPISDEDTTSTKSASSVPQEYSIRQGDTMWDICKIVLDNPWYWPKLWSLNQYILNPNLIYPGNRLAFSPGTDSTFPKMEVVKGDEDSVAVSDETVNEETGLKTTVEKVARDSRYIVEESNLRKGESLAVKLRSVSFVSNNKSDLKTIGKVGNSIEQKTLLNFGDQLYLNFYSKRDVKVGDKFQVIEKVKTVFDPDRDSKRIGWMVKKKAVVTVKHIIEDKRWRKRVVEAVYSDGDDPIQREDEIVPYQSNVRAVIPHFTEKNINGKIVEAEAQQILISNNDFVYINLGTKDGVQPGLQLYVVRRGDGLEEFDNDGLPDFPVAKLLIIESFSKTSTAYVTSLDRALSIGDRVRSHVE